MWISCTMCGNAYAVQIQIPVNLPCSILTLTSISSHVTGKNR